MSACCKDRRLDPDAVWEARVLLETADRILARIESGRYPPDRIDSVAWRIADALLIVGQESNRLWPGSPTPGVTKPTGRGAMLASSDTASRQDREAAP